MKSAMLLFLIVTFVQVGNYPTSSEDLLPLDSEQEECIEELQLQRATMAQFSSRQYPPEDNINFNNFFSCAWKKQGYQFHTGLLNYTALEKMLFDALKEQAGTSMSGVNLAKQMATAAVSDCKHIRGNSHGQTAIKMQNCMYRKLLKFAQQSG